jgi:hypothetical protein
MNRIAIVLTEKQKNRFWLNVTPAEGHKDCWLWVSRVDGFGYGHFKVKKRSLKAHRVAWTIVRGPIPDDKTLDHICRVPRCVNPFHLALVSNRENILRGTSFAAQNARRTHCRNGHEFTPENTVVYASRRSCRVCLRAKGRAEWDRGGRERQRRNRAKRAASASHILRGD